MPRPALFRCLILLVLTGMLGACATPRAPTPPARKPADIRAEIVRLMPASVRDREGWATDITAAFAALRIEATTSNLCSVLAVTEQESTFTADPAVPNLPAIARAEIDRRAKDKHIPQLAVRAALAIHSTDGRSYAERIAALRSERQMSLLYEELIGRVPLGQRLFANANPVRTGGPMQVSIAFAEHHAREHGYPYEPADGSIRHEVFSRRGGMYFGIAHLLGYPASYDRPIYRYADFNAGFYASRNAAFQNAVSLASGIPLALDGDLLHPDRARTGATELAVRALGASLGMSDARIRRELERQDRFDFEDGALYPAVFSLAEQMEGRALPRAMIPRIDLKSPKIQRALTTEWFATRVEARWKRCMQKAGPATGPASTRKKTA